MASNAGSLDYPAGKAGVHTRPVAGLGLDWAVAITSAWIIGGLYTDLWAHSNGLADTSFFTPWHALLYSGLLATILVLVAATGRNMLRGYHWMNAVPKGYEMALLGAAVFALGGAGDAVWHTLLGIEVSIEALLSPPHLLIATGGFLLVSGPMVAAWSRHGSGEKGLLAMLPILLSALYGLTILNFFTQYTHPIETPFADAEIGRRLLAGAGRGMTFRLNALGVGSFVIQSVLLSGMVLLLLRRWRLPFGTLTLFFGVSVALMTVTNDEHRLIVPAIVAGVVGDLMLLVLKPSVGRAWAVRVFAFLLPLSFFGIYLLGLALVNGVGWSMNIWSGATFLASIAGLLVSFLAFPPAIPGESTAD